MKSNNKFDRSTIIITSIVIAILGSITIFVLSDDIDFCVKALVTILNISILFLSWAYHPQYFFLENKHVGIKRFFKSIEIPVGKIIETRQIGKDELSGSIRLFGSGGLFGYFGRFSNKKLGTYFLYAGNLKNLLLIKTDNKVYVISPENPQVMIEGIEASRNQP